MSATPLTHHDVIALAEPFARRGWRVDLAASSREERRLVFRPVGGGDPKSAGLPDEPPPTAADSRLHTLTLDRSREGGHRLIRTLRRPDDGVAMLSARGPDPAALLDSVLAVPAARHFGEGPGYRIERDYRVDPGGDLLLIEGRVLVPGLRLKLSVADVRGLAGELSLQPLGTQRPDLPEDLLAVLGWNWARLVPDGLGWSTRLRLRGATGDRTRRAEAALERAAAHLARTLVEPPAAYHERLRRARRGVFLRRAIPTLTAVGLVVAVVALGRLQVELSTAQWIALYHVPTLIVALSFALQELPRFEIPPWPRPLAQPSWFGDDPGGLGPVRTGSAHTAWPAPAKGDDGFSG